MGKEKNFVYTDLSSTGQEQVLFVLIDGVRYEVVQYNDSWATNEIPIAQLILAVGRDLTSDGATRKAAVHLNNRHKQMVEAEVYVKIQEEYDAAGTMWPNGRKLIFKGYFLGFTPRKLLNKYQVVANLVHWLIDMTCSSCLTSQGHFSNATQLNVAAVLRAGAATAELGAYEQVGMWAKLVEADIESDVWGAIKKVFCKMANTPTLPLPPGGACGGSGKAFTNTRALKALSLIEGPGDCKFTGKGAYSVPLKIKSLSQLMTRSVADGIANQVLGHYANVTFWDKLVGEFCPMFGMAVVPMVDRALVVADLPGYRGGFWKDVTPDEYDALDLSPMLEQPLRAIGVSTDSYVQTQASESRDSADAIIGGCYVEDSVAEGDGIIRIVPPPAWLSGNYAQLNGAAGPDGTKNDQPGRAVGCDGIGWTGSQTFGTDDAELFKDYAKMVYVGSMLRGRTGQLSGRLRFDIAPNSMIRLSQRSENQMEGEDELAATMIACVSRVSTSISAEGPRAGTSMQISHLRTENPDNTVDRMSVAQHPLFGTSIHGGGKYGAPLVPDYDL